MSKGIDACWAALARLKSGKPNKARFKGKTITANLVSLEAGFSPGYIKPIRHPELCEAIQEVQKQQDGKMVSQKSLQKEKKAKQEASNNSDFYKKAWQDALAREIRLIKRVRELESKLESIQ